MEKRFGFMRLVLVLALAVMFVMAGASTVKAAEFPGDGVVPAGTTIDDDVFLNGGTVTMDGTVNGALVAAGNFVTINGAVNGDVIAMGSMVVIGENAVIEGNLFTGAQVVEVRGVVTGSLAGGGNSIVLYERSSIERNLYLGGFAVETKPGATVGKDAFMACYQGGLAGAVKRDLYFGGAALDLSGSVGRDAKLDIGSPAEQTGMPFNPMTFMQSQPGMPPMPAMQNPGLRIASGAEIGGKLTYTSPLEQSSAIQSAPAGGIVYQTPVPDEQTGGYKQPKVEVRYPVLGWFFNLLRNLVTLLILGALVLWLAPVLFRRVVDAAALKPLPSAGYGFLAVLAGYVGAFFAGLLVISLGIVVALVSLGGLSKAVFGVGFSGLALVMAVFTLLVGYGSKLVVAFLVGDLFVRKVMPQASKPRIWALVFGVFFYAVLRSIPVLGWLIGVVATVVGLGAMWLAYRASRAPAVIPAG